MAGTRGPRFVLALYLHALIALPPGAAGSEDSAQCPPALHVAEDDVPAELWPGVLEIASSHPHIFSLHQTHSFDTELGPTEAGRRCGRVSDSLDTCPLEAGAAYWLTFSKDTSHRCIQGGSNHSGEHYVSGAVDVASGRHVFHIKYACVGDAFHGMGLLISQYGGQACSSGAGGSPEGFSAGHSMEMVGAMLDCSRGKVPRVAGLRALIRQLALLGYTHLILYIEDLLHLPSHPMFGHLRGRYSTQELREVAAAGGVFGVEVLGGVQALGHMEQALQWPQHRGLRASRSRLHMDHPEVYRLLHQIVATLAAALSSTRIHIGLDEPFGIDQGHDGSPTQRHAQVQRHLARVATICHSHGLRPMAYSDPLFRLRSPSNDYYDASVGPLQSSHVEHLPQDLDLVYWDYYHTEPEHYTRMMDKHAAALQGAGGGAAEGSASAGGRGLVVAAGGWSWNRLWAGLPWAYRTVHALLTAVQARPLLVRKAYVCLWMDDGAEVELRSTLPILAYFAARLWAAPHDAPVAAQHAASRLLRATAGVNTEAYIVASGMDVPPGATPGAGTANVAKWLLWEDPLLRHLSAQLDAASTRGQPEAASLPQYYHDLATWLHRAAQQDDNRDSALVFAAALCRTIGLKVQWQQEVQQAYEARDRALMAEHAGPALHQLAAAVENLWRLHRTHWLADFKPFGLEVLEMRYGTLRLRLQSAGERLEMWCNGDGVDMIDELEEKPIAPYPHLNIHNTPTLCWGRAATAALPSLNHETLCPLM